MKKLLALLAAVVMVLCLSVSAFAAENTPSATVATFVPGEGVTVAVNTNEDARLALDAAVNSDESVAYLFDASGAANTITIKLSLADLSRVLHWENGAWKQVEASYADGTLTATSANGWSPIAVLTKNAAAAPGGPTAPQTSDVAGIYVACATVMACAAAAFVVKSKKAA